MELLQALPEFLQTFQKRRLADRSAGALDAHTDLVIRLSHIAICLMPDDLSIVNAEDRRRAWRSHRRAMERSGFRYTVNGIKPWGLNLGQFGTAISFLLRLSGFGARGHRNASIAPQVRKTIACTDLPTELKSYRILHLSDLHMDFLHAPFHRLLKEAAQIEVDLCVITGDFMETHGAPDPAHGDKLKRLVEILAPSDGVYGILGNHDSHEVEAMAEAAGIRILVNETVIIEKAGARLVLTGTDDVHCFYTDEAVQALQSPPDGFRIALVHSPEIADVAAAHGYHLYLTGHTHGGQVCLPGGRPVFSFLERNQHLYKGVWTLDRMSGHTTTGLGVTIVSTRFNCRGEIALLELVPAPAPS